MKSVYDKIRDRIDPDHKVEFYEHLDNIAGHKIELKEMKSKLELKILIGVSASGKSTWCKNFVLRNDKWCIVSRDDLRYAWQNKGVVDMKLESVINKMIEVQIESLFAAGYNVLYDATNLKAKYINDIAKLVKHTATVTYQIFDVPKETAIERDSERERSVGRDVIERQYKDYLVLLDSFDFKQITPAPKKYIAPKIDSRKKYCVLVDIDGTLAHTSGKRSPFDFTKVTLDDADENVRRIVNCLTTHHEIVIVTGREETCRSETMQWLQDNGIAHDKVLMRKASDFRKDSIIKEEIFWKDIEPFYNVVAVFDDRDQVIQMWRSLGLKCFQCDYGNF